MFFLSSTQALWTTIGIMLLAIQVIVFIHELGHYIVAKYNKVRIAEFAVGMGPVLFSFRRKGTTYSFRIFPVGGYVAVLSKSVIEEIDRIKKTDLSPNELEYVNQKLRGLSLNDDYSWQKPIESLTWGKKAWFAAMGVIFNVISAFLLLTITYTTVGKPVETQESLVFINSVNDDEKMAKLSSMGLESRDSKHPYFSFDTHSQKNSLFANPEDYIEKNIDIELTDWIYQDKLNDSDSIFVTGLSFGEPNDPNGYTIRVSSNSKASVDFDFNWATSLNFHASLKGFYTLEETEITKTYNDPDKEEEIMSPIPKNTWYFMLSPYQLIESNLKIMLVNVEPTTSTFNKEAVLVNYFVGEAFLEASTDIWSYFVDSWIFVADFFTFGAASKAIGMEASFITNINLSYWIFTILNMMILLSIVLGAFNILPIPPLDGWKIGEAFYFKLSGGKEIPTELNAKLSRIGWTVIMVLFVTSFFVLF